MIINYNFVAVTTTSIECSTTSNVSYNGSLIQGTSFNHPFASRFVTKLIVMQKPSLPVKRKLDTVQDASKPSLFFVVPFVLNCWHRTGNVFTNPVRPTGSPTNFFVDEESRDWFESQDTWPLGYFVPAVASSAKRIQEAVNRWVGHPFFLCFDAINTNCYASR